MIEFSFRFVAWRPRRSELNLPYALLTALLVLFGIQPVTSVHAQTDAVIVRLRIDAVDIINCFDSAAGFGCGNADFYPVVTMNGGIEQVGAKIDDNNHPRPDDWQFDSGVIPYVAGSSVPVTIDIYDSDGIGRFDDDHADISPTDGMRQLTLTVTMGAVPCLVDLPAGANDGTCGQPVTSWGFEGDEGAEITFRVDILNQSMDSDGDGLADEWETNGVTFNGQFINLPAMGADPNKPDIFIHLDWMQDTTYDQRLSNAAIQRVVNAFANSGYVGPTGSVGINLHVDQGSTSTLNFSTGATWGALSAAQAVPWQESLGSGGGDFPYNWTEFQAIKTANFHPTGRSPIFHYAIAAFCQEICLDSSGVPLPQGSSSGISRNSVGSGFADGASDFLITLGGISGGSGSIQQQAGTLMHELGHNLGLQHGGDQQTNFKPNYPSIMNYFFQLGGLAVTNMGVLSMGVVDYSHGTLNGINEGALDESAGLGAAYSTFGIGTRCPIAGSSPLDHVSQWSNRGNLPFDWNCDGDQTDGIIAWDANGSGEVDAALEDSDDWSNIKFLVGAIGDVGDGDLDLPAESPGEPVVTTDKLPPTTTATLAGQLGTNGWYISTVEVTLSVADTGGVGVALTEFRVGVGDWTTYTGPFEIANESSGYTVEFRSMDYVGNLEPEKAITIKIDATAPTMVCGVSPNELRPPNHKLTQVTATVSVSDLGSGPDGFRLMSVSSNEPDNATGDGDTPNDIQEFMVGASDTLGLLRAERSGTGSGRIYAFTYEGYDKAGNVASCDLEVRVR